MLTLGQLIKHHRTALRWTSSHLAEKVRISTTQMCAIEKDKKRPSLETYLMITGMIYLSALEHAQLDKAYFVAKYTKEEYEVIRDMWQNIFNEEKGLL